MTQHIYKRYKLASAFVLCNTVLVGPAFAAQCGTLLTSGGFETLSGLNPGNNVGEDISPWVLGAGDRANVVQVNGPSTADYLPNGPESDAEAATGDGENQHYLDIADGSNDFYQTFTLAEPQTIIYSGYFSARNTGVGSGSIEILSGAGVGGAVMSSTGTIATSDNTAWTFTSQSVMLPAGTYSFVVSMDDSMNFDNANIFGVCHSDNDSIPDNDDLDDDNDGIPDSVEGSVDTDGDGIPDSFDLDSDNDGIPDIQESGLSAASAAILDADRNGQVDNSIDFGTNGLANAVETSDDSGHLDYDGDGFVDTNLDSDGDGVADFRDIDKDNDGIPDLYEGGLSTSSIATYDQDGDGQIDPPNQTPANVVGDDGVLNAVQGGTDGNTISHPPVDTDGDGINDVLDLDSDSDGIPDLLESGLTFAEITGLDADGNGQIDPPSQTPANVVGLDGVVDSAQSNNDGDPLDTSLLNTDGDPIHDFRDLDSDNDGLLDLNESGQADANGDGLVDDTTEAGFVTTATLLDSDGDGIPDNRELDSNNNGVFDIEEPGVAPELTALDGNDDGVIDAANNPANDPDEDGIYSSADSSPVNFGTPSGPDSDGDGIGDLHEQNGNANRDTDNDGDLDHLDTDSDGDGSPDDLDSNRLIATVANDSGNSGVAIDVLANDDFLADGDSDNAGVTTLTAGAGGTCLGISTFDATAGTLLYTPSIGDTGSTSCTVVYEVCNNESGRNVCETATVNVALEFDTDNDGIPDDTDLDDDNDGISDSVEGSIDTDGDGILDRLDLDSDNDGIPDLLESGLSVASIAILDANNNGQIDDNNNFGTNGLANAVETADDSGSVDYDGDGSVDTNLDTDSDGVADFRDLDKDNDGIPDLLESGLSTLVIAMYDQDGDGQIDPPSQTPANVVGVDGILDPVQGGSDGDALAYTAADTDEDGVVDALDLDSDSDGIPDLLESGLALTFIASLDTDSDGQIDPPSQTPANAVGHDGVVDSVQGNSDGNPLDTPLLNTDGDLVQDFRDLDSDNDGLLDLRESGQVDSNGDGLVDVITEAGFVTVATLIDSDGDGIPDNRELDSDNDGVFDNAETGVEPELTALDMDNDGVIDAASDPNNDTDNDGIFGSADVNPVEFGTPEQSTLGGDTDGDGISDLDEQNGDPNRDTDGDGILDFLDEDSDNDGFPDNLEETADCVANDGTDAPDDGDCDDDGVPDRLQDEALTTAVTGVGSSGFGLLALLMLAGAGRRLDRRELASKGVLASLALLISANAQAHDNYSARLVVPDSEQDWVVYNEDSHGGKREAFVSKNLDFYSGYYFGIGVGLSHVDPEGRSNGFETDDSDSSGAKVMFGRHFKTNWAWELSYVDLGSAGLGNPTNSTLDTLVPDAEIDYRVPAVWLKYLPFDPNRNLTADVKVGISVLNNSASDSRIGFDEISSAQLAFGVGAQMRFAQRYFLRADLESYDRDANFASVTLGAYFRGHDEHRTSDVANVESRTSVVESVEVRESAAAEVVLPALVQIDNPPAECQSTGHVLASVNFETDSAYLSLNSRLNLVDVIAKRSDEIAGVHGHADARGNAAYNLALSKERVDVVISYLATQGVDTVSLQTKGFGEERSLEEGSNPESLSESRRVDIYGFNCS